MLGWDLQHSVCLIYVFFLFQLLKTFPNATKFLKSKLRSDSFSNSLSLLKIESNSSDLNVCLFSYAAIVSFGKVSTQQKEEIEKFGVAAYAWDEFLSLVSPYIVFLTY